MSGPKMGLDREGETASRFSHSLPDLSPLFLNPMCIRMFLHSGDIHIPHLLIVAINKL